MPASGESLTISNGVWTGNPAPTFAYVWNRDGTPIVGVAASTYELADDDLSAMDLGRGDRHELPG